MGRALPQVNWLGTDRRVRTALIMETTRRGVDALTSAACIWATITDGLVPAACV
jgi:hypothetical protein